MASVTAVLPLHSEFQTNRIRWQDGANGLIDASDLRADAGTAWFVRFQLSGNGQDSSNNIVIRTVETPDGSLGSSAGPHLSDAAEQYVSFATLSVPGMTDLVLAGPDHPDVATRDSSEPYQWVPGDDYDTGAITYLYSVNDQLAGLAAWVEDFKGVYAADNTVRATLVLDDGVSGTPTTPEQLAGLVTAGEPVVSGNAVVVNPVLLAGLVTAGEPAVTGDATIASLVTAPSAMKLWLIALLLPWDELSERWATACAIAIAFDGLIAAGTAASHEWSPVTCRSTTLPTWGRTLPAPATRRRVDSRLPVAAGDLAIRAGRHVRLGT